MKKFAFLVCANNSRQFKNAVSYLKFIPDFLIRFIFKNMPPFKISDINKIQSSRGLQAKGSVILMPLLSEKGQKLGESELLEKILNSAEIASRLGAKIMGINGSCAAIADKQCNRIIKRSKVPVTTGSAFKAWSVFEACYRVMKARNIRFDKSAVCVLSPESPVGSLIARKFSEYVKLIRLFAPNEDKIKDLKESLRLYPVEAAVCDSLEKSVKDADIVINNSCEYIELDQRDLKSGAIFCDISSSDKLFEQIRQRGDLIAFKAGLIKAPGTDKLYPAALAETILLSLEERFTNYSLGENVNADKMEEIADIAVRHGFEVFIPESALE